jgi:ribose transport system substrate-binding protein
MEKISTGRVLARVRPFVVCCAMVVAGGTVAACGSSDDSSTAKAGGTTGSADAPAASKPAAGPGGYEQPNAVLTDTRKADRKGPRGESGVMPADVKPVSAAGKQKLAAMKPRVGIAWHSLQLDYSRQVQKGLKDTLTAAGVPAANIFESEAGFDPEKQAKDVEDLLTRKLDLLIVHPSDDKSISVSIRMANKLHIPVVVIGSAAQSGKYESLITSDNYMGGYLGAEALCGLIGNKGEIGIIDLKTHLWHADERSGGFRAGLKATCPQVKTGAVAQANGQEDGQSAAENMLTAHPDLAGMWTVYDVPGVGASNAAKSLGRQMSIVTHDVGSEQTALEIKNGQLPLKATVAQQTILSGEVAGRIAAGVLLKQKVPPLAWIPVIKVDKGNVGDVYASLYGKPLGG